jgi:hypothetical protein
LQVKKRNYLNSVETVVDGIVFLSKKEAKRYEQLKYLEKAGVIKDLKLQPQFLLLAPFVDIDKRKHRAITYTADFQYWDNELKMEIVEDVKGFKTDVYKIKKKLFLNKFALHLREV